MAHLRIVQPKSQFLPPMPHKLFINGQFVGVMQTPSIDVSIPAGIHQITIGSLVPFLSSTRTVRVDDGLNNTLEIKDRERVWDLLFVVDIICWIVDLFIDFKAPWDLIYQIFTNGYFAIWILYEFIIRKKYFLLNYYQSPLTKNLEN